MQKLIHFLKDESATTAIEYSLIASLVSIVIVVSVGLLGTTLTAAYELVADALK